MKAEWFKLLIAIFFLQWVSDTGGDCSREARVCGYLNGAQNNWLFTQHISKDIEQDRDNYTVTIFVNITYRITNCRTDLGCVPRFNIQNYKTNSPQSQSNYQDTSRYNLIDIADTLVVRTTETFDFALSRSEDGFYLAFQDQGTCVTISRVIVYRRRCPAQQIGLVLYPEVQSPASGQEPAEASCVANAHAETDLGLMCDSEGTWIGNPMCSCNDGYMQVNDTEGVQSCEFEGILIL